MDTRSKIMTTKLQKLQTAEVDGLTGNVIYRDLNDEELKQRETDLVEAKSQQAAAKAQEAARASALAKLSDLGLTAEEIAAL